MRPETVRKRVRQVEAGSGKRPDLTSSQEREKIPWLRSSTARSRFAQRSSSQGPRVCGG
jgi:hypothetical protein